MRLYIHHRTDYRFSEPQARVVQLLRLTPNSHVGQTIVDWRVDVDRNARLRPGRDGFGNETAMLYVDGPVTSVSLTVTGEVLTEDRAGMVTGTIETLPPPLYARSTPLTTANEAMRALAMEVAAADVAPFDRAHRLMALIHRRIRFDRDRRHSVRNAVAAFGEGAGNASDIAHIHLATARQLGLPGRYVSGHVLRPAHQHEWHQAAHAWVELHIPEFGWIAFDATADRCPDDRYVRVAIGLDYRDAAPVSGTRTGGGSEIMDVGVRVGLDQGQEQA
ncbi:transglutaminase family protein [Sphingomonas sp. KC8]|uniref:transglutaminase family protein n=1 Tax=Sphingomonas sp. KC8 TaxID=1030157 RepID=UPI0002489777|nr:transglutaminase family protein [Sphingomonas sp. KC8]ARS26609.1 transglutaminase [Sphingomonas sp. KC8]